MENRYKSERVQAKRLKGILFILYLLVVLFTPISIGYMRHNLHMDI
jgi:hypothetical protein